jgi:hypothetical protein
MTILGGLSASRFAQEILQEHPEVDFIIRVTPKTAAGAGASAVKGARLRKTGRSPTLDAQPLYRTDQVWLKIRWVTRRRPADLDELDFVDLDFLDHHQQYLVHEYIVADLSMARTALDKNPFRGRWLLTRGCKYHCSYCGGSKESHKLLAGRQGIVLRSPEKVVEDLARLQEKGVDQASMTYDIAELGEDYWQAIFAGMRSNGIKIGLYNEFFQLPEANFISELTRTADMTHSCVALSSLVGTERVRRMNGKHYSNQQLFDILDVLSQHKVYIFVYFSLNLPGETMETFQNTLQLAQDIYQFYPKQRLKMLNTVHTIDPVSPMNMYADKFGVVSTMKTFKDFYEYCRLTQHADPGARSGLHRGFDLKDPAARSLEAMANAWDLARQGREISWWPIPPSW